MIVAYGVVVIDSVALVAFPFFLVRFRQVVENVQPFDVPVSTSHVNLQIGVRGCHERAVRTWNRSRSDGSLKSCYGVESLLFQVFVSHVAFDVRGRATSVVAERTGEILSFAAHVNAQVTFHVGNAEKLLSAMITDEIERIEF